MEGTVQQRQKRWSVLTRCLLSWSKILSKKCWRAACHCDCNTEEKTEKVAGNGQLLALSSILGAREHNTTYAHVRSPSVRHGPYSRTHLCAKTYMHEKWHFAPWDLFLHNTTHTHGVRALLTWDAPHTHHTHMYTHRLPFMELSAFIPHLLLSSPVGSRKWLYEDAAVFTHHEKRHTLIGAEKTEKRRRSCFFELSAKLKVCNSRCLMWHFFHSFFFVVNFK